MKLCGAKMTMAHLVAGSAACSDADMRLCGVKWTMADLADKEFCGVLACLNEAV